MCIRDSKFGVRIHKRDFRAGLGFRDIFQQNADHFRVIGASDELVGVVLRIIQFRAEGRARHQNRILAVQFRVDGFGKAGGIAIVEVYGVRAGDLVEHGHRGLSLIHI